MKLEQLIYIAAGLMIFSACGKKDGNGGGGPEVTKESVNTVATFKYYKGGFYPPPDSPNWSHDMIITFTTSGFSIEAKHADPLCGKSGNFTEAQATELFELVAKLTVAVKGAGGPVTADAGVEYIEITLEDGTIQKYHLMNLEVPVGELYATNPAALSAYLKDLEASLAVACQ